MGLRKASAYSKRTVVPYTRVSKKKNQAFIKTVPPQKIVKFTMGTLSAIDQGKLPHRLHVVSAEKVQIRDNALEAARQFINKKLEKDLIGNFVFKVFPFPHHIQRENKMLTGAGADRMSTGMQLSFGKTTGKAAIMKNNTKLFFFALPTEKAVANVRHLLDQTRSKMPGRIRIIYEKVDVQKK